MTDGFRFDKLMFNISEADIAQAYQCK
uniref:Uncharacterized protein n=1 Tax=Schistosoma haematobium TaxID=6185 RepID=A0A094ZLE0_SCHHA